MTSQSTGFLPQEGTDVGTTCRRIRVVVVSILLLCVVPAAPRYTSATVAADPTCSVATGYVATPAPSGPSITSTCQVLQAYLAVYNRHDLPGALRVLSPDITIRDCDFTWHVFHDVQGIKAVTQWLRDRFAEHDQLNANAVVGGGIGDTPTPRVFAFHGTRSNDALSAQGLPGQDISGSKGLVNTTGNLLAYYILFDYQSCERNHPLAPGANPSKTRTVVQTFLDAYNAHDLPRVLETLTGNVVYTDCDFIHHTLETLRGKTAVRHALRTQLGQGDVLTNARIAVSSTNPARARITADRHNRLLSGERAVHLLVTLEGRDVAHIGAAVFAAQNGVCLIL